MSDENFSETIRIRVTPEQRRRLDYIADREGIPFSQVVRDQIDEKYIRTVSLERREFGFLREMDSADLTLTMMVSLLSAADASGEGDSFRNILRWLIKKMDEEEMKVPRYMHWMAGDASKEAVTA